LACEGSVTHDVRAVAFSLDSSVYTHTHVDTFFESFKSMQRVTSIVLELNYSKTLTEKYKFTFYTNKKILEIKIPVEFNNSNKIDLQT